MLNEEQSLSILPILQKVPLFEHLDENSHREIIKHITLQLFPKGHVMIHESEMGDAMYIIRAGDVVIYHDPPGEGEDETVVASLGASQFFGEMALIMEKPRNANVRAQSDVEVFILKKEDFLSLLAENPNISSVVSKEFIDRVKENKRASMYGL